MGIVENVTMTGAAYRGAQHSLCWLRELTNRDGLDHCETAGDSESNERRGLLSHALSLSLSLSLSSLSLSLSLLSLSLSLVFLPFLSVAIFISSFPKTAKRSQKLLKKKKKKADRGREATAGESGRTIFASATYGPQTYLVGALDNAGVGADEGAGAEGNPKSGGVRVELGGTQGRVGKLVAPRALMTDWATRRSGRREELS
ncbi:hypothetical protein HPB48_007615 [Haemaphysalis longicornis]|uniref:Uncharacterized protein n=1 Tax=Haemaphysalis longicornis TaxID=44386 RepID=A0A9J6G553_HAELO|nr:hypothetical protein HPB48_007615 [Haemaphysalis longicornis]